MAGHTRRMYCGGVFFVARLGAYPPPSHRASAVVIGIMWAVILRELMIHQTLRGITIAGRIPQKTQISMDVPV